MAKAGGPWLVGTGLTAGVLALVDDRVAMAGTRSPRSCSAPASCCGRAETTPRSRARRRISTVDVCSCSSSISEVIIRSTESSQTPASPTMRACFGRSLVCERERLAEATYDRLPARPQRAPHELQRRRSHPRRCRKAACGDGAPARDVGKCSERGGAASRPCFEAEFGSPSCLVLLVLCPQKMASTSSIIATASSIE
jgi:hypothetical protein